VMYKCAATPPIAVLRLLCPAFEPYAQVSVPDAPLSPKFQV
jgi:hypothetical protein